MYNPFPEKTEVRPTIYAYSDERFPGCLKVGYTGNTTEKRVGQQYPIKLPHRSHKVVLSESAMREDGSQFGDHDVFRALDEMGLENMGGEWYRCTGEDVMAAIVAVRNRTSVNVARTQDFAMRPEQKRAVDCTIAYYKSCRKEKRIPKFLWNAKMRFGKTFAAYQLAKAMEMKKILILTFKPAVQSSWKEDLRSHVDFDGWQFICRPGSPQEPGLDEQYEACSKRRPIVCFGSFQDFLGVNPETGGIKAHNEWVHTTDWDLVIFDEYHYGAWKDKAKKLFEQPDEEEEDSVDGYERGNAYDESWLPITTKHYLFLSGTPFRALNSGEFIEEQIFSWTYSDEQQAKEDWKGEGNPYASLPRMVMLAYRMPDTLSEIVARGEYDSFDLNAFFSARFQDGRAVFVYEDYVQKWLDLIRGAYLPVSVDDLKLGAERPPMPYSDSRLLSLLSHTLWYMPDVASCCAMADLLKKRHNVFFHDYAINVCAGSAAGIGAEALKPVLKSMRDPLRSKSITLTCGKLTTGVTVKPWSGIFMLRNLKSPETYFQAAFRVQSPWTVADDDGNMVIIKKECYVFDFALNRALRQIADYGCKLSVNGGNPEKSVGEFIRFLPVLAYDGSTMRQVNAEEILDITMSGTSATLLAKRWESALLVNVDNETLAKLLANGEAMEALMKIEGFRSLNTDIETIINKSEKVKNARKGDKKLSKNEKKRLSEEEKEYQSKRRMIRDKLIKFATRVPVFMYLSDYREHCLRDIITQLEPDLFHKVTGLTVRDFELLVSLNLFNASLMNDAVYKFKRYEDASLVYTGINRHEESEVGLYDTAIPREVYEEMGTLV